MRPGCAPLTIGAGLRFASSTKIPALVILIEAKQRAFAMRALLAVHGEMRDKLNEAFFVANFTLLGRENVESSHCNCVAQWITALRSKSWRASGARELEQKIDISSRERAVASPHQRLGGWRRLSGFQMGGAASGIEQRRRSRRRQGQSCRSFWEASNENHRSPSSQTGGKAKVARRDNRALTSTGAMVVGIY